MSDANALRVHQAVAQALYDNGVDRMFGLMGDANMFMADYYVRTCGGRFVAAANEIGGMCMALGYALISGKPGVCSVTYGPAMTNTMTALVEGVRGTIPSLLITGTTPVAAREALQSAPNRDFALAAGAGYERLRSPALVAADVARALRRAQVERRPIVFDIPAEMEWAAAVDFRPEIVRIPETVGTPDMNEDLENAIGIIAAARRPLVLAGRGAASPEAKDAILRFARRIEAPVATTLKGKDLFRGEDFNLGIFGTLSDPVTSEIIAESDCVIAFGASLNNYTMALGAFRKDKRFVQVNAEPAEVGKNITPDAGLVGHPAQVADLLIHWLNEAEIPGSGHCSDEFRARLPQEAQPERCFEIGNGMVDYHEVVRRLQRDLPERRVIALDSGRFSLEIWKHVHVDHPRHFIPASNFASIGLGLPHAIGAAEGTDRPTFAICGDGGFMNGGLAEFNSAIRAGSDLVVIIINDGCYGAEQYKFVGRNLDDGSVFFNWPDFAPVAIALGGDGVTVRGEADWQAAMAAIAARTKPLLIDIKCDARRIPWDA